MPRNPATQQKHRREVFWQITFPLILGSLLLLSFCGLTVYTGFNSGVSMWRDVSLIWLIAPALILSLIVLGIVGALAYGVIWLVQNLPGYFFQIQKFFKQIAERSYQISDKMLQPLVGFRSKIAGLQAVFKNEK
jgi:hypothetical protein